MTTDTKPATDTPEPPPPPPTGLLERGAAFWSSTVADFDLSAGEVSLLLEACRTMDNLDALDAAIRERGAFLVGSQGQPVINSGLTEARGQRAVLHRLLSALNLPDDDGAPIPTAGRTSAAANANRRYHDANTEASMRRRGV